MTDLWINCAKLNSISSKEYLTSSPFEHYSLQDGFKNEKLNELVKALQEEEYYIEDHDLYQFKRTHDFKNSTNPIIKEFRDFIFSDSFVSKIEKITGLELIRSRGDLHSLKLEHTHYLLCHDDQVEMRAVAFILNLSKDWREEDGGCLELFSSDSQGYPEKVVKKIVPNFNQFNLFTVSSKSFHQISEVISEDKSRISISGWYYAKPRRKMP